MLSQTYRSLWIALTRRSRLGLLVILFLALLPNISRVWAADILLIESYHKEFDWDHDIVRGLTDVLGKQHVISRFEMNTKRLPQDTYPHQAELAWQAYLSLKPKLVILSDDNAVEYLSERFSQEAVPVVFLGINRNPRHYQLQSYANFTGVMELPLLKRSVLMLAALLPPKNQYKILVLFDNSATARYAINSMNAVNNSISIGAFQLDVVQAATLDAWQSHVSAAKQQDYDALFIGLYHTLHDNEGQHVDADVALNWTASHSPLPHFGFWDFSVSKQGNIGGYTLDAYQHGIKAGEMAQKILEGKQPSSIPFQTDQQGKYIFSQSGLAK